VLAAAKELGLRAQPESRDSLASQRVNLVAVIHPSLSKHGLFPEVLERHQSGAGKPRRCSRLWRDGRIIARKRRSRFVRYAVLAPSGGDHRGDWNIPMRRVPCFQNRGHPVVEIWEWTDVPHDAMVGIRTPRRTGNGKAIPQGRL